MINNIRVAFIGYVLGLSWLDHYSLVHVYGSTLLYGSMYCNGK